MKIERRDTGLAKDESPYGFSASKVEPFQTAILYTSSPRNQNKSTCVLSWAVRFFGTVEKVY